MALTLVLVAGQVGFADDTKGQPRPLPDEVAKAWKEAGAMVGWMKADASGALTFVEKAEAGAAPAFRFEKWKDGGVPKLPAPIPPSASTWRRRT